jgi:hypothetical protein
MQNLFDELSPEEKAAVERLAQRNAHPGEILQIYLACGKDEETARHILA